MSRADELTYFVEGMDCASCVAKVERMVGTLPGAEQVKTSFNKQTLVLDLDESQTPRSQLESKLRALGYVPSLVNVPAGSATRSKFKKLDAAAKIRGFSGQKLSPRLPVTRVGQQKLQLEPSPIASSNHALKPWYQTGQGRLVISSGALLLLAWLFGFVVPDLARWGFMLATLVGVWPLATRAWVSARLGDPFSINMLVTLAALGAVAIGQAAEGATVLFFFAVGELLEGVAAGRARAGIQSLAALAPKTALLLEGGLLGGGTVREIPAEQLHIGQVVQVGSGARVPADGTIVAGRSSLDDSPVTGESVPVNKGVGDSVYAGSVNTDGVLSVRVDKAARDTTIARIIRLVEEAEESKAPTARFIDRFSRWYTPAVVLVSVLTALVPPLWLGQPWHAWLYKGIALLLIGCPCALVLSVPAAITSGISAGARRGLLIKGGAVLETIGTVKTVAFDKTGTLTAGRPQITNIIGLNVDQGELLGLAAAIESGSAHPLAKAIVGAAAAQQLAVPVATQARALPGKGVEAVVEGQRLALSSPKYAATVLGLSAQQEADIARLEASGKTVVVLYSSTQVLGLLALRDEPREDATGALRQLKHLGVRPLMLTGDNARIAEVLGGALGLEVQAELLPEDKLRVIEQLKVAGGVAMVGDGINDAPALASSDVGIAMGGGTDVALETAGAALLRENVQGVAELVQLSRSTMQNIRQNIAFALGLKLVFLVTTLLGYTNLWMAILADTGATALVTANALRLLYWKPREY